MKKTLDCAVSGIVLFAVLAGCSAPESGGADDSAAVAARASRLEEASRIEVVELHRFIEDWSNGELPDDDASYSRFTEALADDFVIISPDGSSTDYPTLIESFRSAHGRWQGDDGTATGVLRIEDIQVREVSPPVSVLSYQEWQELPEQTLVRISSVLFRESDDAPGGVEWVHLHEGWLPGHGPDDSRED